MSAVAQNTDGDVVAPILVVDDREDSLRAVCAVLEQMAGVRKVRSRSGRL